MNNLRLLTGLLTAFLSGIGACAYGQTVMTLEEVFEAAETNSTQLRPFIMATEEATRETAVARSARMPDIKASLSVGYIGDGFTTQRDLSDYQKAPIPHFSNEFSLTVEQPLYTGGAIRAGVELAELRSSAAHLSEELSRNNLRLILAGYYLELYKLTNRREVVDGNLNQARKVLSEMRARYDQGLILLNDITRYELLVANLELQIVKIDNTREILNRNLVVTAGLPQGTVIVPDSTILNNIINCISEDQWCVEAYEHSPQIGLARSGVNMSRSSHKLIESERLPKVGLRAGWTIDGPILTEVPPIDRNLSYWYVGIGISYNLSSLYKTNKSVARSKVAVRRAIDAMDAVCESVELGIHADYVRYIEAFEELKTRYKSVELAQRNYSIVATRYNEDMALITDLIDAANSQLEAEQNLVNSRIDIIYYYYKLLFTAGKI